jgi:nicotinamidase-related amidase
LIIACVVTEVGVGFLALSALEEGYDVFIVTDASGTFNEITYYSAPAWGSAQYSEHRRVVPESALSLYLHQR